MPEQPEQKQETVGEVAAAMRRYADILALAPFDPLAQRLLREYADRVERAADRDRDAVKASAGMSCELCERLGPARFGNAAAMREALKYVLQLDATDEAAEQDGLTDAERIAEYADHIEECQKKARAALAAPARNCDRFATAAEAYSAWESDNKKPPEQCFLQWLFATAEEKGGDHA